METRSPGYGSVGVREDTLAPPLIAKGPIPFAISLGIQRIGAPIGAAARIQKPQTKKSNPMRKLITADHLRINDAATEFSIPYAELLQACREGILPSIRGRGKQRNTHFVLRQDLQQYLDNTRKLPGDDCPTIEICEPDSATNAPAQSAPDVPQIVAVQVAPAVLPPAPETPNPADTRAVLPAEHRAKKGRKSQVQIAKDSMRKLRPAELLAVQSWITGRLQREFGPHPAAEMALQGVGDSITKRNDGPDAQQ